MNIDEVEEYRQFEDEVANYNESGVNFGDNLVEPSRRYFEDFDNALSDIDFSDIRGDFKKSLSKVNNKIATKQAVKKRPIEKKAKVVKPLDKDFGVKRQATIEGGKKQISKVIVPNSKKVIVEGVSNFILSQKPEDDSIRNLGYYKGKKLNQLVLIFNNNSLLDFNLQLFNPSMPLDYLYSTSLNLNNKIQVAGGVVAYTDVLYNLLANPALLVNAKFVVAGPQVQSQLSQPISIINKSISGVEKIVPINIALQIDNMQVQNDMVAFDIMKNLNRPFIPDGMDVAEYTVLAGNTVTMCFWYKQVSLKKVFYEEARNNKTIL